ncbi:hypothetical protein NUW54_g13749 [Trametes sanguinea]|uniref:Uncharacterized protein n=1 Tax=Trametes sanguinea TaxID=158606 RepID=A0ACC1MJ16_9APHY|nr:hypothetical protein NUW54_g13749 [Trametes sanguinea]
MVLLRVTGSRTVCRRQLSTVVSSTSEPILSEHLAAQTLQDASQSSSLSLANGASGLSIPTNEISFISASYTTWIANGKAAPARKLVAKSVGPEPKSARKKAPVVLV